MREKAPTFLMDEGSRIKEVFYTDWVSDDGAGWTLDGEQTMTVSESGTVLVVELPVGCFQLYLSRTRPGDSVTLAPVDGGGSMMPCQRPRFFEQAEEEKVNG